MKEASIRETNITMSLTWEMQGDRYHTVSHMGDAGLRDCGGRGKLIQGKGRYKGGKGKKRWGMEEE